MSQSIETNLEKLWKSLEFDLDKQIPLLHYQYKHLGYDYPQIFTTHKGSLGILVQNTFYQFMIARFGHLFSYFNEDIIQRSDKTIKEEYNKLFVSLEYGKKEKMNTVLVIISVIVGRIIQKIFPNVIYNQRLTIQLMHCLIISTLGIMVGDNSIKYMIGKEIGARQITRFLFREMFEKKILIAKIKEIEEQKQWPELKKLFYNPPPSPPQKLPFDEGRPDIKVDQGFIRGLDSYHLKSIQMSRAFLNNNQTFKLKQSTLKKYACKVNVSLECNSPFYKSIKKIPEETSVNVISEQKKQVFNNKKNLKYWQRYIINFKNTSSTIDKQKFPPIVFNDEHKPEPSVTELPLIPLRLKEQEQIKIVQKSNTRYQSRQKNQRQNLSVHQKKDELKESCVSQKLPRNTKHRAPGRTVLLKNQSKLFYENRLQIEDGEALANEFNKLSFIR